MKLYVVAIDNENNILDIIKYKKLKNEHNYFLDKTGFGTVSYKTISKNHKEFVSKFNPFLTTYVCINLDFVEQQCYMNKILDREEDRSELYLKFKQQVVNIIRSRKILKLVDHLL